MSNFRSAILIIGLLIFFVASALLTVLILYAAGVILTDPIELVYSVDNAEKFYDGQPLTAEEYRLESGEILEGHTAQVEIKGSRIDAGTSESTLEVKLFDKNGFDVSKEYSIKVITGTLTVKPQDITVSIKDTQALYNGQEVDFENYELIEGTLADGHRIAAAAKTGIVNVGDRLDISALQPLVFNAQGASVTGNYNIKFDIASVEIIPRPVTVAPVNITQTYDGTVVVADKFEITAGSVVAGHYLSVKIVTTDGGAAEAQNVSKTHIKIGSVKVTDAKGATVTGNYDIDFSETAYLTISKKPATVVLNYVSGENYVYSGTEIAPELTDILSDADLIKYEINTDAIEIVPRGNSVNAGTYDYTINYNYEYGNYEITFIPGTYTIMQKTVTITLKETEEERSVVYGGTYDFDPTEELICEEYTVDAANYTVRNDIENGRQVFKITGITLLNDDNEDITSNLKFNSVSFDVALTKRALTFTYTECDFLSYRNGEDLAGHVQHTQLAVSDEISFEISVNSSYTFFAVTNVKITDANGNNVTKFYDIDTDARGTFIYPDM